MRHLHVYPARSWSNGLGYRILLLIPHVERLRCRGPVGYLLAGEGVRCLSFRRNKEREAGSLHSDLLRQLRPRHLEYLRQLVPVRGREVR